MSVETPIEGSGIGVEDDNQKLSWWQKTRQRMSDLIGASEIPGRNTLDEVKNATIDRLQGLAEVFSGDPGELLENRVDAALEGLDDVVAQVNTLMTEGGADRTQLSEAVANLRTRARQQKGLQSRAGALRGLGNMVRNVANMVQSGEKMQVADVFAQPEGETTETISEEATETGANRIEHETSEEIKIQARQNAVRMVSSLLEAKGATLEQSGTWQKDPIVQMMGEVYSSVGLKESDGEDGYEVDESHGDSTVMMLQLREEARLIAQAELLANRDKLKEIKEGNAPEGMTALELNALLDRQRELEHKFHDSVEFIRKTRRSIELKVDIRFATEFAEKATLYGAIATTAVTLGPEVLSVLSEAGPEIWQMIEAGGTAAMEFAKANPEIVKDTILTAAGAGGLFGLHKKFDLIHQVQALPTRVRSSFESVLADIGGAASNTAAAVAEKIGDFADRHGERKEEAGVRLVRQRTEAGRATEAEISAAEQAVQKALAKAAEIAPRIKEGLPGFEVSPTIELTREIKFDTKANEIVGPLSEYLHYLSVGIETVDDLPKDPAKARQVLNVLKRQLQDGKIDEVETEQLAVAIQNAYGLKQKQSRLAEEIATIFVGKSKEGDPLDEELKPATVLGEREPTPEQESQIKELRRLSKYWGTRTANLATENSKVLRRDVKELYEELSQKMYALGEKLENKTQPQEDLNAQIHEVEEVTIKLSEANDDGRIPGRKLIGAINSAKNVTNKARSFLGEI